MCPFDSFSSTGRNIDYSSCRRKGEKPQNSQNLAQNVLIIFRLLVLGRDDVSDFRKPKPQFDLAGDTANHSAAN